MEDIKHTYTIQWVGPLSYDEYKEYVRRSDTLQSGYFNFYYFEARQDARYNWHRYVGIHKENDGINRRLNTSHSHLKEFLDCKDLRIWIGSFADAKNQKEDKIELVETLLIQAYRDELTENDRKKVYLPKESVCLINLWFDQDERLKVYNIDRPCFDDVVLYYSEEQMFKRGNLSRVISND